MSKYLLLGAVMLLAAVTQLPAQEKLSWRKHVKLAENLYAKAQYADAGEHYRAAFRLRPKDRLLAYRAGECFAIIRDYRNAVEAWLTIKDHPDFPMLGLQFARALKQSGDYESANSEFNNFLGRYKGSDKQAVAVVVQNEQRGCELAAQLAVRDAGKDVKVRLLGNNINTPETEFAPFPFGDEVLYFSSTKARRAAIYRSLRADGEWQPATPVENIPVDPQRHFCNGSLAPDGQRFYFTLCKSVEKWGGLTTQCEIFMSRRADTGWSAPEPLPAYINDPEVTTTHPYVVHQGQTEILYFSTNRMGGSGGMDIWYATRDVNSPSNDFTLPLNCGSLVNTSGDEITPYYDIANSKLYFASNGHVSVGGYDVFAIHGMRAQWSGQAENLGVPFNSPADDFFFVETASGTGGFLVSNRTAGVEKITTTQEDIFEVVYSRPVARWQATGEVFDKLRRQVVPKAEVALYEVSEQGPRRFLTKVVTAADGRYVVPVEPARTYLLEAMAEGYFPASYAFDTRDAGQFRDFGAPLYLEPYREETPRMNTTGRTEEPALPAVTPSPVADPSTSPQAENTQPGATPPASAAPPAAAQEVTDAPAPDASYVSKSKADNYKVVTEAPRQSGTYYKIQLIAVSRHLENLDHPRFREVARMGRLDKEYIMDNKLCRVLLGDYETLEAAQQDIAKVRLLRDFGGAFAVEYKDGERIRTWEE
jgi:hypothetical protein